MDEFTSSDNIMLIRSGLEGRGYTAKTRVIDEMIHVSFEKEGSSTWLTTASPALSYPVTHNAIRQISRNKTMANDFVHQLGYRVPRSSIYNKDKDMTEVNQLLDEVGRVIVKPEYGSLSRGVTLDITTKEVLQQAIDKVYETDWGNVVIQEQVYGDEIRFVLIDGRLTGAALRQTPRVVGDGSSTLKELIQQENISRSNITDTAVPYPKLDEALIDGELLSSDNVPADGEVIELGKGTMIRSGASIYNVMESIHPSYAPIVEDIAKNLGAKFVVIDMLLSDYTQPADANYSFIEFNTSPVLKLFYSCRDGNHFDIVPHLVDLIDRTLSQR